MKRKFILWFSTIFVFFIVSAGFVYYSLKTQHDKNNTLKMVPNYCEYPYSLYKFNKYLGQRIAIWGTVISGERKGTYPYVAVFDNSKMPITLWFSYSEKDEDNFYEKLNIDSVKNCKGISFSVPDKRRTAYISGVLNFGYILPATRKKEIDEDGVVPRLPLTKYGEFFLNNPIVIKIISKSDEDIEYRAKDEIKKLELTPEDIRTLKTPYLFDATPKTYETFVLHLRGDVGDGTR